MLTIGLDFFCETIALTFCNTIFYCIGGEVSKLFLLHECEQSLWDKPKNAKVAFKLSVMLYLVQLRYMRFNRLKFCLL